LWLRGDWFQGRLLLENQIAGEETKQGKETRERRRFFGPLWTLISTRRVEEGRSQDCSWCRIAVMHGCTRWTRNVGATASTARLAGSCGFIVSVASA
jgi:hypothetical protein